MNDKATAITLLREVFNRWEEVLATIQEEQITAQDLPSQWSIKDVIIHLWAWQQISIARLEAAVFARDPTYPTWPVEITPASEGDVNAINAWIYQTYHEKTWSLAYQDWQKAFLKYLELAEQIPEKDLVDREKYAWMGGWPLFASLQGAYEHHHEHLETLLTWLRLQEDIQ